MNRLRCRHDSTWTFHSRCNDEKICVACNIEYLEKNDNSLVKKITIVEHIAELLKYNPGDFAHCLTKKEGVVTHYCRTLVNFLHEVQDNELVSPVIKCIEVPLGILGLSLGEFVLPHIISTCYSAQETNSLHTNFSLLFTLMETCESIGQILVLREHLFVKFLLNATEYPDNELRILVLKVFSQLLLSISKDSSPDMPVLFRDALTDLPSMIFNLLSGNDNVEVILQTIDVLKTASVAEDFILWLSHAMDGRLHGDLPATANELLAGLKRILLKREERLTLETIQCLMILIGRHSDLIRNPLLNADLAEFIYDALRSTTSSTLVSSIYCCILLLTESNAFHMDCHAMYGLESVLRSLQVLLKTAQSTISAQGIMLLRIILDRQPDHVCILKTLSLFDRTVEIIKDGLGSKYPDVVIAATESASSLIKHFPVSFPILEISSLLKTMSDNVVPLVTVLSGSTHDKSSQQLDDGVVTISPDECLNSRGTTLRKIFVAVWNVLYRTCELVTNNLNDVEINPASPGSKIQWYDIKETVLNCVEETWLKSTTKTITAISSPTVIHSMLATVAIACRSLCRPSFIHKLVTGGFIRLAFTAKSRFYGDVRHGELSNLCGEFLCSLTVASLSQSLGEVERRLQYLIQTGFSEIRGKLSECINLIGERSDRNEIILAKQCAVFAILFNHYWHGCKEFVSISGLREHLSKFFVLASSLNDFPLVTKKQIIFLCAVCNADTTNKVEVPSLILSLLMNNQKLYIHHPIFVSYILRVPVEEPCVQDMQYLTLNQWVGKACENREANDLTIPLELRFLIDISKIDRDVVLVIIRALSCDDVETDIGDKFVHVIISIFKYYQSPDSDQKQQIENNSFCATVARKLSEYAYGRISSDARTSEYILRRLLRLLILVTGSSYTMDLEIWSFLLRILKTLLILISTEPYPQGEIVETALHLIRLILVSCKQENQMKSALTAIFSKKPFQRYLLHWGFGVPPNEEPHSTEKIDFNFATSIEIISMLIKMQQRLRIPVLETLVVTTTSLQNAFNSRKLGTKSAVLEFWACIMECQFMSDIVHIKHGSSILSGDAELFSHIYPILRKIWNESLNLTATQSIKEKEIGFRCAVALFSFTSRSKCEEFLNYLANHPWLDVVLVRSLEEINKCNISRSERWMTLCMELTVLRKNAIRNIEEECAEMESWDNQEYEEMIAFSEQN